MHSGVQISAALQKAINRHRARVREHRPGQPRVTEFFLFPTLVTKPDGAIGVTYEGPRLGLNAEAIGRVLLLLDHWERLRFTLAAEGMEDPSREVHVGLFTEERVYDVDSGEIYTAQVRFEDSSGLVVPRRDPSTGLQQLGSHSDDAHFVCEWKIAVWTAFERLMVVEQAGQRPVTLGAASPDEGVTAS